MFAWLSPNSEVILLDLNRLFEMHTCAQAAAWIWWRKLKTHTHKISDRKHGSLSIYERFCMLRPRMWVCVRVCCVWMYLYIYLYVIGYVSSVQLEYDVIVGFFTFLKYIVYIHNMMCMRDFYWNICTLYIHIQNDKIWWVNATFV